MQTAPGYCWVGSNLSPRRDAWRCFRGDEIQDPCYSGSPGESVACPIGFPSQRVLRPLSFVAIAIASF